MRLATMGNVSLPNFSVRLMMGLLNEAKLDSTDAVREAGIPWDLIEDPIGEVTGAQELSFQRAFYARTHDRPDLWVELGGRYRLLSYAHAAFGLAMSTARDLQELFEFSTRFDDLHYTLADATLIYADDRLTGFGYNVSEVPEDLRQFTMLRDFASNSPIFADLWGEYFPFIRVETGIDPKYSDLVCRLTSAPVTFKGPTTQWLWPAALSNRKLRNSNPLLHGRYKVETKAIVDEAFNSADIVCRLEALLQRNEAMTLRDAADHMGMTARTLQRRLSDRGLSYRDFAFHNRYQQACGMLVETSASIASIAWRTGYDNVSSFNHAFKRRSGLTPGAYRQSYRSAALGSA